MAPSVVARGGCENEQNGSLSTFFAIVVVEHC
jgi:hypothetical protein